MTQPNQTTPTALSTGPWTIYVCPECGQQRATSSTPDHRSRCGRCGCAEYRAVEVIPLSTLSRLAEELEARADEVAPPLTPQQAQDLVLASEGNRARLDAYADGLRAAASLISQSLPKGQSDG